MCREAPVAFQNVAFLSNSELAFTPHSLRIVLDVKTSGQPHALKLWLWVGKGMLHAYTFASTNHLFVPVESFEDHNTVTTLR